MKHFNKVTDCAAADRNFNVIKDVNARIDVNAKKHTYVDSQSKMHLIAITTKVVKNVILRV